MNINMSNDRDQGQGQGQGQGQDQDQDQGQDQGQDQIQNKSQNQSQTLEQEQESRLFTMLTTPCQLHETWTEFLLEVLCELEEVGLIKRISPESEDKNDEYEYLKKDPNLRRRRTVSPICRYTKRFGYKKVPFIRLSGLWLEKYGFFVGQRFLVYPKKDQLLLKKTSRCSDWLLLSERIKNRT